MYRHSLSEPIRELYIWGRFVHLRPILFTFEADLIHLRPIRTFEADSLYIWGRLNLFSHVMPVSQSENRICTFEADFKFYASNVQRISLKCHRESASNVRTGRGSAIGHEIRRDWPGEVWQWPEDRTPTPVHLRPIWLYRARDLWFGRRNHRDWPAEVRQWPKDRTRPARVQLASNVRIGLKCMYRSVCTFEADSYIWPI